MASRVIEPIAPRSIALREPHPGPLSSGNESRGLTASRSASTNTSPTGALQACGQASGLSHSGRGGRREEGEPENARLDA